MANPMEPSRTPKNALRKNETQNVTLSVLIFLKLQIRGTISVNAPIYGIWSAISGPGFPPKIPNLCS